MRRDRPKHVLNEITTRATQEGRAYHGARLRPILKQNLHTHRDYTRPSTHRRNTLKVKVLNPLGVADTSSQP